jgi:hypothetical protein
MELRIHVLAAGFGSLRRLFARRVGERLRAAAGLRQGLLVGHDGGVGRLLGALRVGEIAFDPLATILEDRADAWQRDPRHQHVKQDESQREPEQLGREGRRVERREPATVLAPGNMLDR